VHERRNVAVVVPAVSPATSLTDDLRLVLPAHALRRAIFALIRATM
jgi:hypothetical protein